MDTNDYIWRDDHAEWPCEKCNTPTCFRIRVSVGGCIGAWCGCGAPWSTEKAKAISARLGRNRLGDAKVEAMFRSGWRYKTAPRSNERITVIQELLARGNRVTAGWCATKIRGYREGIILWKQRAAIKSAMRGEGKP